MAMLLRHWIYQPFASQEAVHIRHLGILGLAWNERESAIAKVQHPNAKNKSTDKQIDTYIYIYHLYTHTHIYI